MQKSTFSIIALALLFITQSLGLFLTVVYRVPASTMLLIALVHFSAVLGFAFLLRPLSVKRSLAGSGFLSPLPPFLALCVLLACAGHTLGHHGEFFALVLRAIGFAGLAVTALYGFFLFVPPERKGICLGLAIAAGELVWLALLPGMNALSGESLPALSGQMHRLQMIVECAIGILLVVAFAVRPDRSRTRKEQDATQADTLSDHAPSHAQGHAVAAFALPLLFAAAAFFYGTYGLASGLSFPRVAPGIADTAHLPLLLIMPLAGAFLDKGGRGCRMVLLIPACLVFTAPIMVFASDAAIREALYAALCVGRQSVFLITLFLVDRLLRNRKRLSLLAALAYGLPAVSIVGSVVSRMSGETVLTGWIAIILALAFTALVFRLRGALADLPVARDKDAAPMPDTEPHDASMSEEARLAAFAISYGLSEQETKVMEMLAQRNSSKEIAMHLNVEEVTVRTYIARMMKKTDTHKRAELMARYAAQNSAARLR
ncbi:MAG: LuxR family transcriptional regulator [Deltaproteobacteria bacterium]|jgi:DNA-binding CsgD family transcriptional regulator|nr:LuxR family transcriptional regulator [Deltaproteobacteria bacterium]